MRKYAFWFLPLFLAFALTACGEEETHLLTADEIFYSSETDSALSSSVEGYASDEQQDTLTLSDIVDGETAGENPDEESSLSVDSMEEDSSLLTYMDSAGDWHEAIIQTDTVRHSYDWTSLTWKDGIPSYDDGVYTTRRGLDVSSYQQEINWKKVKKAGYEFVFIRIGFRGYGSEGTLNVDENFKKNYKEAKAAGLDVGVYFFSQATTKKEAREEAAFVLKTLKDRDLDLPVVYDVEQIQNDTARTDGMTQEQFTENMKEFCSVIEEAGFSSMVYANLFWETNLMDMTQLKDIPIWYADYWNTPQTPYDFTFWQYTEEGQVDGIKGSVDLNLQFING